MAYFIFIVTMLCIYVRPFGLPLWIFSTLGAACAYIFGAVNLDNILLVWDITKPSTLALIGLILLSLSFEKLGFFTHLASLITPRTHPISTWKFFVFLVMLGSVVSVVFANDGAILVLTPLVLALFGKNLTTHNLASTQTPTPHNAQLHTPKQNLTQPPLDSPTHLHSPLSPMPKFSLSPLMVFLLLVSFVSDFASNALVISNLTNIITAQMFSMDFTYFALMMALPQVFGLFAFVGITWLCFRKFLPRTLHFSPQSTTTHNPKPPSKTTLALCYTLIIFLLMSIAIGQKFDVPLYVFLFFTSAIALCYGATFSLIKISTLLKETPISVIIFSFGLFVVVFGVKNAGFIESMRAIFGSIESAPLFVQIFSIGLFSSLGSSIANNLPMVLLGNLTLQSFELDSLHQTTLALAHLLGCNIGSKLTPIGSLATLLFLLKLKISGVQISLLTYLSFACIITLCVLCAALFGLWVSTKIFT